MKVRLFDATSLTEFSPRNVCFAEADAGADVPAPGGNVPGPVGGDEPELVIEPEDHHNDNHDEADLEEYEYDAGKKYRVPKALKEQAEMGKDYRYKTGLTAAEKRAAEAERTRYAGMVKQLETNLKASEPQKPDAKMLDRTSPDYDPDAYHLARANWENWAQKTYGAEQERKRLEAEDNAKEERARGEKRTATERDLIKAFPQWRDPAVRAAERVKLEAYIAPRGHSPDEIKDVLDHDATTTEYAYKAMLYDQAIAKARARDNNTPAPDAITPTPVRKTTGGGGGRNSGPPKDTEGYIKWRQKGGKM